MTRISSGRDSATPAQNRRVIAMSSGFSGSWAIGVIGSIISTYSVKAGDRGNVEEAMRAVNKGFILGSIISVVLVSGRS